MMECCQVRKFCLQYGASLFYTSVKEDKNCDLLYKYLVHRIYHFPFKVGEEGIQYFSTDFTFPCEDPGSGS